MALKKTTIAAKKIDMQIGSIIRKYRKKSEMTQIDLALRLGYKTAQFVSLFERGVAKVPFKILGMLVVILKIPEAQIVGIILVFRCNDIEREINEGKKSMKSTQIIA